MTALIVAALSIMVFVLVLIGALKGLSNGISRMAIRFATIIISIIIAALIAGAIGNSFIGQFNAESGKTVYDVILSTAPDMAQDMEWLLSVDVTPIKYIAAIPFTLIIGPMIFVPLFIVISGLMLIIAAIICTVFRLTKKKNNLITKLCGLALGIVQGLVVSAMVLLPVVGLSSTVSDSVEALKESAPESESTLAITEAYDESISSITENALIKTLGFFGGNLTYNSMASIKIDGEKIDMTELGPDTVKIYAESARLADLDWKNLSEDNKTAINAMVDTMLNNGYYANLSAELLRAVSAAYLNGIMPFELGEPFDGIVSETLIIFTTANAQNIKTDVRTILDVYFILSDDGVFAAMEADSDAMLTALTAKNADGTTTINKVIYTVRANEHMKHIITVLTKMSLSIMSNQTGIDANITEVYDDVKNGLNTTLQISKEGKTEDEYLEEVSDSIDETLKENGIELEKDIVDNMAKFVSENFEAGTEVTDEDMNDIILSYYDAYLESLETQNP